MLVCYGLLYTTRYATSMSDKWSVVHKRFVEEGFAVDCLRSLSFKKYAARAARGSDGSVSRTSLSAVSTMPYTLCVCK